MSSDPPSGWQALLADLKRRSVFRVAAVYGTTAFILLQVVDLVFPRIGLPDWTVTLIVGLLLVGLPIALALAWALEKGPAGLRRTETAGAGELRAIVAQPRSRRWPAGIAALLGVFLLGAGSAWALGFVPRASRASYDSIAVLPFTNLGGDSENQYFADGLAEELLNALAGVQGLMVAARTSSFAFRDSAIDVRRIGDTLGVATILEGSVRRSADRVRITVQLADAGTGYQLWTEVYDSPLRDLFTVQNAIAKEIVAALAVQLGGEAGDDLYRGGTRDVEAYELYLLGRQKWATRDILLLHEAVGHFEDALARDSSFALAWSGLADALDALAWRREPAGLSRIDEAKVAAQRAILLDPLLAEGWASLGVLLTEFDRDLRFSELALRRAVTLKPSYAMAQLWLSNAILYQGRPTEALGPARRAVELDPLSGVAKSSVALTLVALGRWTEAREAYMKFHTAGFASQSTPAVKLVSEAPRMGLTADEAAGYARDWARIAGYRDPEAAAVVGRAVLEPALRDSARAVLRVMEAAGVRPRDLAELHLVLDDSESAIVLLERAAREGDPQLLPLGIDPAFDRLRDEPRFVRILEALGVPNGVVSRASS